MKTSPNPLVVVTMLLGIYGCCEAQQSATGSTSVPPPTPYSIVANDANSRIWERTAYEQGPGGQVVAAKQSYTELATGLNYQDPTTGQWVPSKEEIDILPDGTAAATNGQHQAYFPSDIYNGDIRVVTPEGDVLQSQPLGLSYDDGSNTVLIAVLTNSAGELVSSNQVLYPNAFVGLNADLLYTYTKGGFEQDIILRAQPPTPESLNMNSQNTRLQMLTEFINPPQAAVTEQQLPAQAGMILNDENLDFGIMKMVPGKAFLTGTDAHDSGALVGKAWENISGRQILVEEVPVMALADDLAQLPTPQHSSAKANSPLYAVTARRLLPAQHLAKNEKTTEFIAREALPIKGVVLDYNTVNSSISNYVFQSDTTYYISGAVNLYGTNTFEGGTVLKYTNGASINIGTGTGVNWMAATYRPVIMTAKDDNSVGETISGSTGNPTNYYASSALSFNTAGTFTLSGFRIIYAAQAISDYDTTLHLYDGQIVNSQYGVEGIYYTVTLRNLLLANVPTDFTTFYGSLDAQNATLYGSTYLNGDFAYSSMSLENCILANITYLTNSLANSTTIAGTNDGFYNCPEFGISPATNTFYPFQTVGGGGYYLANGCVFTNGGTTNIDPVLLTNIATRTVYPPIVYSDTPIRTNMILNLQAPRDTNAAPALGYHYDVLDYVFGGSDLYSNLNVTAGTAIGLFQAFGGVGSDGEPYSLSLNNGANFTATGTATEPCWITYADSVQEGCNGNWTDTGWMGGLMLNGSGSGDPQLNTTFTKMYDGAWQANLFRDNWARGECNFQNSEFWSGAMGAYDQQFLNYSNCFFFRHDLYFFNQYDNPNITIQDCTFIDGFAVLARDANGNNYPPSVFIVENTSFDGTAFAWTDPLNGNTNDTIYNYNAYNTNNLSWQNFSYPYGSCYGTLQTVGSNSLYVTNYNWEGSWLGNYYLPTNSPLINAGSTTADQMGLFYFTTQTNQVFEGFSAVDIGYHYVAVNTNGVPFLNQFGTPDYLGSEYTNITSSDGISDAWEEWLGLNPEISNFNTSSERANYTYTLADWLNLISGSKSGTVDMDNEGNVTQVSQ
jgi:hypothetical protein